MEDAIDEMGKKLKTLVQYKKAFDKGEDVSEEQVSKLINEIGDKFLDMEHMLGVYLYDNLLRRSEGCNDYVELLCMLRSGANV